ncbi:MAG: type II secretion system secretin GspD [Thiobacillus sp.]|nr:type II secretion system secretin GspD [Thiobacillus sp.]
MPAPTGQLSALKRLAAGLALAVALCAGPAQAAENKVTLNFVNADIESVMKAMGDMTKQTFVVDPRVKGTLQITSPRPVSPGTAYEIVLAALRMQGYAAVQGDGVVRIVPEADAKFYAPPSTGKGKRRIAGEMMTRVFVFRHESALQMLPALRPLVGASSAMSADAGTNSLLVTDYADNLERLAGIVETLDVPSADEPVLVPLKYAAATDVAGLIGKLFGSPSGSAASDLGRLDVAVDTRSNSLIVRGRDRSLVSRVQNMVAALDTPTQVAGNVHVIYLKNAEATKVAETLRKIVSADTSAQSADAKAAPATPAASVPTGGAGMVQADPASNALIVTAPEAVFNNIKAVVEKLDVRRAQVLVEALIAEVSADKAAEFGIQWVGAASSNGVGNGAKVFGVFGNSDTGGTNIGTILGAAAGGNPAAAAAAATGFNLGLFKDKSLGLLAHALETQAGANILSTPTLLTLDNEEAKISVGSNVPFTTGQYTMTGSGNTASPFQTIERKDVGLSLKVKPQISEGGTVRLQIAQEVSKLRANTTDLTLSSTDKRAIESTVLVDDGQIVVLGGLIEEQVEDTEDKVPGLGDLPVLGHLFRYDTRKHVKTNLMVFLRPVIVRNAQDAAAVTHSRYDYILGQQQAGMPEHKALLPDVAAPTLQYDLNLAGPAKP